MATIDRPELAIGTDQLQDLVTLSVSCEVHFTEFEVNAVNLLGLRYRLHCRLFNKDLWDIEPVAVFDDRMFTREGGSDGLARRARGLRHSQEDERPAHSRL